MKTKNEITFEYTQMIEKLNGEIEGYEDYLNKKYTEVEALSTGNRGIEEILEEIENMQKLVADLLNENETARKNIVANENDY